MRIEDQVCSLELAKRLKELGVEQNSYFSYEWYSDNAYRLANPHDRTDPMNGATIIDAFTVSELGKMLPDAILFHNSKCYIKSQKKDNEYKIYIDHLSRLVIFFDENEADARAKMLIYLIENGLIKENFNAAQEREV